MAFKRTYRGGEADDYGDDTAWAVEDGVLKMGRVLYFVIFTIRLPSAM
jgi:hypothetical protein